MLYGRQVPYICTCAILSIPIWQRKQSELIPLFGVTYFDGVFFSNRQYVGVSPACSNVSARSYEEQLWATFIASFHRLWSSVLFVADAVTYRARAHFVVFFRCLTPWSKSILEKLSLR
jgi:hypothetical protein